MNVKRLTHSGAISSMLPTIKMPARTESKALNLNESYSLGDLSYWACLVQRWLVNL